MKSANDMSIVDIRDKRKVSPPQLSLIPPQLRVGGSGFMEQ